LELIEAQIAGSDAYMRGIDGKLTRSTPAAGAGPETATTPVVIRRIATVMAAETNHRSGADVLASAFGGIGSPRSLGSR
jgi:hypothetical protein